MSELEVYAWGMCHCSVCTNVKDKDKIVELTNKEHPTGLSHGWEISEENFAGGSPNPTPCEGKDGFNHYLMVC